MKRTGLSESQVVDLMKKTGLSPDELTELLKTKNIDDIIKNAGVVGNIVDRKTFKKWEEMKDAFPGEVTKFLKENKPLGSPDIKKWLSSGGTVTIETVSDGTYIWTFVKNGEIGIYIPKMINGKLQNVIDFPDEYLYPQKKSGRIYDSRRIFWE